MNLRNTLAAIVVLALLGVAGVLATAAEGGLPAEAIAKIGTSGAVDILGDTGGENLRNAVVRSTDSGDLPLASSSGIGVLVTAQYGGTCDIPTWPDVPGNIQGLGFSWCPSSVDYQLRVFAQQAAVGMCAMSTGTSSTPEQINSRRHEINSACEMLAGLASMNRGPSCLCPSSYLR